MYEFMQMNRNLGQSNKLRYKIFTTYQNDDLRLYILSRGIKLHKQLVFYAQQNFISLCILMRDHAICENNLNWNFGSMN